MDDTQPSEVKLLERRPSRPLQNVDDLYNKLGDPGRYQVIIFFLLSIHWLMVAESNVVGVVFSYSPDHTCYADEGFDTEFKNGTVLYEYQNATSSASIFLSNITVLQSPNVTRTSCTVTFENVTKTCRHGNWRYDVTDGESSAVTDFDLVCDDKYLNHLASTMYYVGVTLGGFVFGYISDVFGRHRVAAANLYLLGATCVGIAFSQHYIVYVVLRVLSGFFTMGLQTSSYILVVETFPVHHRSSAGTFIQVFWGLGVMYLAGVSWALKNWRYIQLAVIAPMCVSLVAIWFIPESLRWLLTRGKTHRAHKVIKRFCRFNALSDPLKNEKTALKDYKVHYVKGHATYLDLFRTPQMRKRTFCMGYIMFAANIGYYGLTFNTATLPGNRFLTLLLSGVAETLAAVVTVFVTLRFGRKRPLVAVLLLGAVCCIIAGVVPRGDGVEGTVIIIASVLGRMLMSCLFLLNDIFCAELFPTITRNMAYGVCSFAARIGAVIAPQIFALTDYTFYQLPPVVIAVTSLIGAGLTLLLPETSGKHLPDTIEDVETNFGWGGSVEQNGSNACCDQEKNEILLHENGTHLQENDGGGFMSNGRREDSVKVRFSNSDANTDEEKRTDV